MEPEKRKRAILDAAVEVFGEKGYHNAAISDIIERASIARGTFYLYFRSKQDIFERILEELFRELDAAIKRIDPSNGYENALEQLHRNIDRVISILTDNRHRGKILMHTAVGLEREIDEKLERFYLDVLKLIISSLHLGMNMGLIRKVNADIVSLSILGSFKEILYHFVARNKSKQLKYSRTEIIKELIDYNLRGLLNEEYFLKK